MNSEISKARMARSPYYVQSFDTGVNVMEILDKELNGGEAAHVIEGMLAQIQFTHRYLQNEIVWALLRFLVSYGEQHKDRHDARNQDAVEACRKLAQLMPEIPIPVKVNWDPTLDQQKAFYESRRRGRQSSV